MQKQTENWRAGENKWKCLFVCERSLNCSQTSQRRLPGTEQHKLTPHALKKERILLQNTTARAIHCINIHFLFLFCFKYSQCVQVWTAYWQCIGGQWLSLSLFPLHITLANWIWCTHISIFIYINDMILTTCQYCASA